MIIFKENEREKEKYLFRTFFITAQPLLKIRRKVYDTNNPM